MLAVFAGMPVILPAVALDRRRLVISAGVQAVHWLSSRAVAPATCGHAMEVPDIFADAVSDLCPAEVISDPGAKMSTHGPWLL